MSFSIILNKNLTQHQFDYLTPFSGRRLDPTIVPNARRFVKADESVDTWVSEVMTREIVSLSPSDNVKKAISTIKKNNIHHIPLIENNLLVGMVSDRDIMWSEHFKKGKDFLLRDLMTKIIVVCDEDTPLDHLAKVFYREQINGMAVIDIDNQLVGMVTHRDILRWVYEIK